MRPSSGRRMMPTEPRTGGLSNVVRKACLHIFITLQVGTFSVDNETYSIMPAIYSPALHDLGGNINAANVTRMPDVTSYVEIDGAVHAIVKETSSSSQLKSDSPLLFDLEPGMWTLVPGMRIHASGQSLWRVQSMRSSLQFDRNSQCWTVFIGFRSSKVLDQLKLEQRRCRHMNVGVVDCWFASKCLYNTIQYNTIQSIAIRNLSGAACGMNRPAAPGDARG